MRRWYQPTYFDGKLFHYAIKSLSSLLYFITIQSDSQDMRLVLILLIGWTFHWDNNTAVWPTLCGWFTLTFENKKNERRRKSGCLAGPVDKTVLRIVQNQALLFLNSMTERVGSDIQRVATALKLNDEFQNRFQRFKFWVVPRRIRLFPTLITKIKWLGTKLPLK